MIEVINTVLQQEENRRRYECKASKRHKSLDLIYGGLILNTIILRGWIT